MKIFAMRCDRDNIYKGRLEEIDDTLEAKQEFVGGIIQCISLTDEIDIILNDEGKLMGLPTNRLYIDENGYILDLLVGNVFACRHKGEEFTSILESDIPLILNRMPAVLGIVNKKLIIEREGRLPDYETNKI